MCDTRWKTVYDDLVHITPALKGSRTLAKTVVQSMLKKMTPLLLIYGKRLKICKAFA